MLLSKVQQHHKPSKRIVSFMLTCRGVLMAKERLRITLVPLSPVDGGSRAAHCCASTSSWRPCECLMSTVPPPAAPLSSARPRLLSRSRSVTPSVSPFPGCLLFPQHFHLFQRTLPSPDRLSEGGRLRVRPSGPPRRFRLLSL